jgi:phosphoribosylglycinamide formyltransferase-1
LGSGSLLQRIGRFRANRLRVHTKADPNSRVDDAESSPKRLAVFASGRGSNLIRIQETIDSGELTGVVVSLVISNRSKSGAMDFACERAIPSAHISAISLGSDERCSIEMLRLLAEHSIDFIALTGYLKKVPDEVVERYSNRILNVHPALLPAFGGHEMYGSRVHEAVIARGCKVSGATVHLVSAEYDAGPIVMQECCEVRDDDTPETLAARVLEVEHRIMPIAVGLLAADRLKVDGNIVSRL